MSTLATDNGLHKCGWAIVGRDGRPLDVGVIVLEADTDANGGVQRDRIIRAHRQAAELVLLARANGVKRVAVETLSFNPQGRVAAVASLCLSVGVACGISAALDIPLIDVAPKTWQHAVLGVSGKVDYELVFAELDAYARAQGTAHALASLARITKGNRNHALDAIGVGVYAEIRQPHEGAST